MIDIESIVRQLAKSSHYQTLYGQMKESGVRLFRNQTDLTKAQIMFLNYLSFYNSLTTDVFVGEVPANVLEREIDEDAYMYWKGNNIKKDRNKKNFPQKKEETKPTKRFIFKHKKK